MSGKESGVFSKWSREEDKIFENGLVIYREDSEDRWEKIAADIPGRSVEDVKHHYQLLLDDLNGIKTGRVPLPRYDFPLDGLTGLVLDDKETCKKGGKIRQLGADGGKASGAGQERRKGIPWTEDEHKQFLLGLDKYGKGDWRSISRFVGTRTPAQVASHAQKYFLRLNTENKDRKRTSIHDITYVSNNHVSVPQGPITGQTDGSPGESSQKPSKQVSQSIAASSGVVHYSRTTIGEPVGGHLISAVGTPVNLPQQAHMAFGLRDPVPEQIVPGPPFNMGPATYPMPRKGE